MIRFALNASVIDYAYARRLLYSIGCGARRDQLGSSDKLIIYPKRTTGSLFVRESTETKPIGTLDVDEGYFDGCLSEDSVNNFRPDSCRDDRGRLLGMNDPWMELVDATDLMAIVVKKLAPGAEIEGSNMMGRGSRKRHFQAQYAEIIKTLVDSGDLKWELV